MKNGLLLLLFALLLLPYTAKATPIAADGAWWSGLDESGQLAAVGAGLNAYMEGFHDGAIYGALARARDLGKNDAQSNTRAVELARAQSIRYSHTYGFYRAAVTDFYTTNPGASAARVGEVLGCLADNPILPCDELAKLYMNPKPDAPSNRYK
jgi:hypothetical protein